MGARIPGLTTGPSEETGMPGSVEIRAVVEGIRIARELDPVVAARVNQPTAQHAHRPGKLIALVVVDQVAALDHRVGPERPDRADGAVQHLGGQRLLGPEGRLERIAEPVQERDAGR